MLAFIVSSCTIERRHMISGYFVQSKISKKGVKQKNTELQNVSNELNTKQVIAEPTTNVNKTFVNNEPVSNNLEQNEGTLIASIDDLDLLFNDSPNTPSLLNTRSSFSAKHVMNNEQAPPDSCDMISLKDGNEIICKVVGFGKTDILYKECDYPDGPVLRVTKSLAFMIEYANGNKKVFNKTRNETQSEIPNPKIDILGVAGLILGISAAIFTLFGLLPLSLVIGMPLVLLSMIFAGISFQRIRYRNKHKGSFFAIVTIIIGLIVIIFCALSLLIANF